MLSNTEALKRYAEVQFTDDLAQEIFEQIDNEEHQRTGPMHRNFMGDMVVPRSLATLFLADDFYEKIAVGNFSGRVVIVWNGADNFVFVPDESHPFSYTTSQGIVIRPQLMYTDGGSIPQILRGLKKYSSWGYAPAFIIHDWIFAAKRCSYSLDSRWTLEDAALIMAEAIKTLIVVGFEDYEGKSFTLDKSEDTLYLMYHAVKSRIAKNLWDDDSRARCLLQT